MADFRVSPKVELWDDAMIALSVLHACALVTAPSVPLIALGLWWNCNTISHHFIHRPFFRRRAMNRLFALYLSLLLGIPQSLWRERHLAHHAGVSRPFRLTGELLSEIAAVLSLWTLMIVRAPDLFISVYFPGYLCGLGLCALHGFYEHTRGTTSHYGRLYNTLLFNDGYHAEHHRSPGLHWTRLPERYEESTRTSSWPAPLRWMEVFSLEGLERLALRWTALRQFVLQTHARALRELVPTLPHIERVGVVGGGLFPRTALILEELLPGASITIIDANRANLDRAREMLGGREILFVNRWYHESDCTVFDLVVIPLSFEGDLSAIYGRPPAPYVIVHDWIWRRAGDTRVVSFAMLKRVNLVRQ